jgi:predicted transcriptional regulator
MSERIEILEAWQDAALIERSALDEALTKIDAFLAELGAGEYPRRAALVDAIAASDRSVALREARIVSLSRQTKTLPGDASELQVLLRKQDQAREERDDLISARQSILDLAGDADLTDEQDARFSALTREIAEVDEEIIDRGADIETLAALSGV